MTDRCDYSDLPRDQCAHCGAHPGTRVQLEPKTRIVGAYVPIDQSVPTPTRDRPKLGDLGKDKPGENCACGRPTRNNAYGCDHCGDQLSRFFGDIPWLVEQLNLTIAREHAKTIAAGSGSTALMFNSRASTRLRSLTALLATTTRTCVKLHIRHQSPHTDVPNTDGERDPIALSRWLMWRVDGLLLVPAFPDIIRAAMHTEAKAYAAIDTTASLQYLGVCTSKNGAETCGGAVYALPGQAWGRCRVCRTQYNTQASRGCLDEALAGMLCSAAEIAHLATYLGLPVKRDQVRKLVNQWHRRGRIAPHSTDDQGAPLFNYGDVRVLLEETYVKPEEASS